MCVLHRKMGKNTINNKKKKLAKALKKKAGGLNLESLTTDELLNRAQEHIDTFQYETAQRLCQEALKRDPEHIKALETSASLCLEVGNLDGAKHCLGRAITLQPEEGHAKYMSMAQLLDGQGSLQCYQKGIHLLTVKIESCKKLLKESNENLNEKAASVNSVAELETTAMQDDTSNEVATNAVATVNSENEPLPSCSATSSEDTKNDLIRQISTAYCSIAELFMTDLCDEENAEEECRRHIDKAITADASNPEAYQQMASFLLVKQDFEEAKKSILKSLELWLPRYKEVDEGKAAAGTFDPVEVSPLTYTTRLSTARILIEVDYHDQAVDVLEGLLKENDEFVDTWYLLGWSYYLRGEDHKETAKNFLYRALQVHDSTPCDDPQLVDHLRELVDELGPLIEEEPPEEDIEEVLRSDSEDDDSPEAMETS